MPKVNDLNLKNWKNYADILTDSLWTIPERDKSGAHNNAYHGNFIPQIPSQLLQRFTRKGDVVLDPFLGHGTTLIEAQRLQRHGIGIDLSKRVANAAKKNIATSAAANTKTTRKRVACRHEVLVGDSAAPATQKAARAALKKIGAKEIHLLILHPPYHDIIQFSRNKKDLCNASTPETFTSRFGDIVANFSPLLGAGRHLAIVIGDKYAGGAWVPLGFYLMQETLRRDKTLKLKSIVVKNMVNNRAKLREQNLWRYRALVGGFYIFKHEYIFIFRKTQGAENSRGAADT